MSDIGDEGSGQARVVLRNAAIHGVSRVVETAVAAVVALMISRQLQATGLGIYSTAMAYYGLLLIAAEMGASNLLVREIARARERTGVLLFHVALISLAASAILGALAALSIPLFGYDDKVAVAIGIVLVAIFPGTMRLIQESVFVAHQRVEFVTATTIVLSLANLVASYWILREDHGVNMLLSMFVVLQAVAAVAYQLLLIRFVAPLELRFDRAMAGHLLRLCRPFAASSVVAALFSRPEVIILSWLGGPAAVGFYSAATRVVDLWQIVPQAYMTNVLPVLSRAAASSESRLRFIQESSLKLLLGICLPVSAGIVVAADEIVALLYGRGFEPSVPMLRLLALSIPFFCVGSVLWRVLVARDRQDDMLRTQCLTLVVRLAGALALIPAFGALGASIVPPVSLFVHDVLLWHRTGVGVARPRVIMVAWRFAAAALGAGLFAWVLRDVVMIWLLIVPAAAMYAALVLLLRALSPDDLDLVRRLLPRRGGAKVDATGDDEATAKGNVSPHSLTP